MRGIIIGHGAFAQALVDTAEQIIGDQPYVEVISNKGFSGDTLRDRIADVVRQNRDEELIIFLDLPGGSCTISCYKLLKIKSELNIITGINLPMLIEFFMLRDKYSAKELIPILINKGKDNIIQLRCP